MTKTPDPVRAAHSRLASQARWSNDPKAIREARRQLKAARLEREIKRALRESPRINQDQRYRLAALLQDGVK